MYSKCSWAFNSVVHSCVLNCIHPILVFGTAFTLLTQYKIMFFCDMAILTLPEHLSLPPVFSGVYDAQSLVLCVVFRILLFVLFLFTIVFLSFDLRFLVTHFVYSIFYFVETDIFIQTFPKQQINIIIKYHYLKAVICQSMSHDLISKHVQTGSYLNINLSFRLFHPAVVWKYQKIKIKLWCVSMVMIIIDVANS